jgi:hypothetical protein
MSVTVDIARIRQEVLADPDLPIFHDNETVAVMFGLEAAYKHAVEVLEYRRKRWPTSEWSMRFKALVGNCVAFLLVPLAKVQSTEKTMPELTSVVPGRFHCEKFHSESAYVVSIWSVAYNATFEKFEASPEVVGLSSHTTSFQYEVGKRVEANGFDPERICGRGIHYFANLWTALTYGFNSLIKDRAIEFTHHGKTWTMNCSASETQFIKSDESAAFGFGPDYLGVWVFTQPTAVLSIEEIVKLCMIASIVRFGSIDALSGVTVRINNWYNGSVGSFVL